MFRVSLLCVVLLLINVCASESDEPLAVLPKLSYTIEGIVLLADDAERLSTQVHLTSGVQGSYVGSLQLDGEFKILDVPHGVYELHVSSPNYQFAKVRVTCAKGTIRGKSFSGGALAHPFLLSPTNALPVFEARDSFNLVGLLRSPMVIMIGISALMMVFMPRLLKANESAMSEMTEQEVDELPAWLKMMAPDVKKTKKKKSTKKLK
jgi:ER membrane protein complex subunit 7